MNWNKKDALVFYWKSTLMHKMGTNNLCECENKNNLNDLTKKEEKKKAEMLQL